MKNAQICPHAAKRAIKKMNQCGLNTEGFTIESMCATLGYDKLSFLASRDCETIGAILSAK